MLFLSILISLSAFNGQVENYYLSESTMHGGTPMSGSTYSSTYHFAIHKQVEFPHIGFEKKNLTLTKGDTLIYSVIRHVSGMPLGGEDDIYSEKVKPTPIEASFYKNKFYVSIDAAREWEKTITYKYKKKKLSPELKTEPDIRSQSYAP